MIKFLEENSILLSKKALENGIAIDAEIPKEFLNNKLINILSSIEPFGTDNLNPVLFTQSLKVINHYKLGKEKNHLKLIFETESNSFIAIFWNKASWFYKIHLPENLYNIVYQLEISKYKGQITIQMMIIDMEITL